MPADYSSTAKALALPISPSPSPSPELNSTRPPWTRRISTGPHRRSGNSPYSQQTASSTFQQRVIHHASQLQRHALKTFQSLPLIKRILLVIALLTTTTLSILFLVYNERIFHTFTPFAKKLHDTRGGWVILWIITFCCAFPPVIGYSMAVTISGFVYGFPGGYFVAMTASVAGSLASFIASRTVFSAYVHRIVGDDKRFEALALTLKHDGIKILCMIRLCPLPYSLSNAAMSTFPTVQPLHYALATALASPKLLIHIFIGSRLAKIAETSEEESVGTKAVNYFSIIFGIVLGSGVGYFIYQRTLARAKELEIKELEAGQNEDTANTTERTYTDEDGDELDAAALMNDDDISLWDHEDGFDSSERVAQNYGYKDEFTDDEDVFAGGNGEVEAGVTNKKAMNPGHD